MASLRSYAWWLLAVGWGCAGAPGNAADGGDDTGEEPFHLSWADPSALGMLPGESRTVGVVYVDPSGSPAVDVVSFALVGEAQDASLDSLQSTTDAATGSAQVTLFASSGDAVFRVRATAPLADEIFLDVSVSDSGSGNLGVTPRYVGHREDIEARDARILSGASCADLDPLALPAGDRSLPVEKVDDTWTRVQFPALPPDLTYAAVVTGMQGGSVVAFGCSDGLSVTDQETTEAEVVVDDLSPSPIGEYDLVTNLDLADAVTGGPSAWLEPTRTLLGADGDATGFFVRRIGDYVEATFDAAARGRFETAVGDASSLRAALSSPERDPLQRVDSIAADVETALTGPVLHSVLTVDPSEGGYAGFHDLTSIEIAGTEIGLDADAEIAFADLSLVSQAPLAVTAEDGRIDIGTHDLEFPVGTIAAAVAERVLPAKGGAVDLPDLFASTVDCGSVAQTLVAMGADADCDEGCLADACVEACIHLASSVSADLASANETLGRLEMDGSAILLDDGGDLRAEQLISGLWLGSITPAGARMGGDFFGTRIEAPAE